jgi:hypothetical protein
MAATMALHRFALMGTTIIIHMLVLPTATTGRIGSRAAYL